MVKNKGKSQERKNQEKRLFPGPSRNMNSSLTLAPIDKVDEILKKVRSNQKLQHK